MSEGVEILYVDDSGDAPQAVDSLETDGDEFSVERATRIGDALARLDGDIDCLVTEYDLPDGTGIELLRRVREVRPAVPVVLFTDDGTEDIASDAISAGISDYLRKGADSAYAVLANRIENLVDQARAEQRVREFGDRQRQNERDRERLLAITSDPKMGPDEKTQRLLELGCERFGTENGHLVKIDRESDRHEVVSVFGSDLVTEGVTDLSQTYCRRTIESRELLDIQDTDDKEWVDDPATDHYDIGCYIGTKLLVENELYGTLCFASQQPRDGPFTHEEKAFMEILGRWFSQLLERKRHRNQMETVFEHTQDAIFLVDVTRTDEFKIRRVNRVYEELTGLTTADLQGKTPREIVGEQEAESVETHYRDCVEKQAPVEYEETIEMGEQTRHWQTKLAPVVEEDEVVQLVGSTRDISDQKERERELREQRAFIEGSLDALDDVFYVFDMNGEIVRWNDRLREVTDYTDEQLAEMQATDFFPEDHRTRISEGIEEVLETGSARVRADYEKRDGERLPYEFAGHRLEGPEGEPMGFVGIGRDISDQLEYERQLEEQNERLQEFVSMVSHDLRNPLEVASMRLDLVQKECESEHLDAVERAHYRMAELIEDLLTLAREGDQVDIEPVELERVARECWKYVDTTAVDLVVEGTTQIHADRSRLTQLLENLVRNAIEHGEPSTVTVGTIEDGFYVEDDGVGIPPEDRDQIFEDGYSTSREGTGFGLSIVQQIADAHDWTIRVTDSESGGARFEVTGIGCDDD